MKKKIGRETENLPDPNTIQVVNGGTDRVILFLCCGNTW
jgi:hypothetical protein